ncbi:MAG: protein kinase [Deltaproteobacteria bacterium]|nr:protein kinase [Deltaproteobacteria bacterium]
MSDETPSREGELLAGRYRLQGRLGVGGMGEVYRARNELVGRDVAIKVLRPELCRHVEVVQRFLREARAANAVQHENVVDVVDMGTDSQNVPFIVQELLVGKDLAHHLVARGNRLPVEEILALMIPVVDAIATAHQRGVVHRDLKPENVFLTVGKQGLVPKVLDFGISKIVQPGEEKLTATGTAMGTPTYMSPEQVHGASDLDARADVWALGVMLYELASGVLPFSGPSAGAIFVNICIRDPAPLSQHIAGVSPDYARIVERCLRRDLTERYPSAAALLRDLRHLQQHEAIEPTGAVATPRAASIAAADSEVERLSHEARAHAGETMVSGRAHPAASSETLPASPSSTTGVRVQETMPPVVRSSPPTRRTAVYVGSTAAIVAAIGIAAVTFGSEHAPATTPPRPATTQSAPPAVETVHALVAPTAVPAAPTVLAPVVDASVPEAPAAPALPLAAVAPEPSGRRARGRRRAATPPSTATVALPILAAPSRPAPSGVGTTEYE